ncbi:MAG: CBS domain-containing protein [Hyphomicrobiaceae bacterium]
MKAKDIMTRNVVTVPPGTPITDVAAKLVKHRISAVPIVADDGHLVGLVSESDMLHRTETNTTRKRKWWLEFFVDNDERAREFIKSHAKTVDDVMSSVVVTVSADDELGDVADVLDSHNIRRVPVVSQGKLAGIISRSDLVRALAQQPTEKHTTKRSDYELRKTIMAEIRRQSWINSVNINLDVSDGVVEILGFADSTEDIEALRVLVQGVSGVSKVVNNVHKSNWKNAT